MSTHVDDLLGSTVNAGIQDGIVSSLKMAFDVGAHKQLQKDGDQLEHCGTTYERDSTGYYMHMAEYEIEEIPDSGMPKDADKFEDMSAYKASLGKCLWKGRWRPDAAFVVNIASSETQAPTWEGVRKLNKARRLMKEYRPMRYRLGSGKSKGKIVAYSDASFGDKCRGAMVIVVEYDGNTAILEWCTYKLRRVARSTLGAELVTLGAATAASEWALLMAIEVGIVDVSDGIPAIHVVTDAKSVQSTIGTTRFPRERNLIVDMARLRESCSQGTLSVEFSPTHLMLADPLTKELSMRADTLKLLQDAMSGAAIRRQ